MNACGPFFPNNLLELGDDAVLLAPVTTFERELERMKVVPSRFHAVPVADDQSRLSQTLDVEMHDLDAAFRREKIPASEWKQIRTAHLAAREQLKAYVEEFRFWEARQSDEPNGEAKPKFPHIDSISGLPAEFADYFEGAVAWHNPALADRSMAREPWERLLARPEAERKFKSTWAAFMLGKSWEGEDVGRAAGYFRRVRELAARGFVDSPGLAAASLGLEARLFYRGRDYANAIALYLQQLATGDPTATTSLQEVAAVALTEAAPDALRDLATNASARQVITAQLLSNPDRVPAREGSDTNQTGKITMRWLRAVEAARVENVESAEKLALAAYQAGAFDLAQRWINRCTNAPTAQWLQAKLLLRAGKIESAAALLAKVVKRLPIVASGAESRGKREFADDLFMRFNEYSDEEVPARRQVLGELGVLRLSRGESTQALDALLRAGFWGDAAYVAERVLAVEELKEYVDRNWPMASLRSPGSAGASLAVDDPQLVPADAETEVNVDAATPTRLGREIRYLLARRLTREIHGDLARAYYPAEWLPHFDALAGALLTGWDESQPADQRAAALFRAAGIARTNGMELLGTEVQPDWHIWDGNFQEGVTWEIRAANTRHAIINVATAGETSRAAGHHADPEVRFHYRHQAAFLGWEAARLMPNHSDATALVLWTSGSWLKNRDPATADIFYKALVRRCRKTELGAEADRVRWFPMLDEDGNLTRPTPPGVEATPAAVDEDIPSPQSPVDSLMSNEHGFEYTVQPGDSLAVIRKACSELNVNVTVEELLDANQGLNTARLKIGQKIFIPMTGAAEDGELK